MKWNEWFEGIDLEQPYGKGPMVSRRWTLWKWLEMSDLIKPYQNDQNRWDLNELKWIEVNRGEMSDLMEMTWNNPMEVTWVNLMGKSLWFENECPYQFDLNVISEKVPMFSWMNVPIKVTWNNPMGKSLWVGRKCPYQNDLVYLNENVPIKMIRFDWIEIE